VIRPFARIPGRPLRIAYGRIFHEANTHSPLLTTRADFERMHHLSGEELRRATALRRSELEGYLPYAELTGFVQAARVAGDVHPLPLSSSLAVPGGPLSRDCFEWLLADLLGRLADCGPVDGIYLALHGSMEVDGLGRAPEAVILEAVRSAVRPEVKIAVSYDLHANLSRGLVDPVDVLIGYRTNPHWDLAPTGYRAGDRLIRALRGRCRPVHAWRKLPLVLGGGTTIDFVRPMRAVFAKMRALEADPRVLSASLFMVHPFTAAEDLGWAAHVCTDDEPELAAELAERVADHAWDQRNVAMPAMRTVDAALDEVADGLWRRFGPVSLVDADDIVGAGAPGGSTHIVAALVRDDRGLRSYVPVHDPEAAAAAWTAPLGSAHHVTLRGTPGYGQPVVRFDATIGARSRTDFGQTVRLDAGPFHVVVTERPCLPVHPKFWREVGLNPRRADVIVQKNFFHYRMFYAAISFVHLPVTSDGATSLARVRDRPYKVPTHPGTPLEDWRPYDPLLRGQA